MSTLEDAVRDTELRRAAAGQPLSAIQLDSLLHLARCGCFQERMLLAYGLAPPGEYDHDARTYVLYQVLDEVCEAAVAFQAAVRHRCWPLLRSARRSMLNYKAGTVKWIYSMMAIEEGVRRWAYGPTSAVQKLKEAASLLNLSGNRGQAQGADAVGEENNKVVGNNTARNPTEENVRIAVAVTEVTKGQRMFASRVSRVGGVTPYFCYMNRGCL